MSKESNRRKSVYNIFKWIQQRLSWVGDKLLTLVFYLSLGLFILAYKIINKGLRKSWALSLFVLGGIKSHWRAYRLQKRIKTDFQNYGIRDYYKEQREAEE